MTEVRGYGEAVMVTVYTKSNCPQCTFTKRHLEGLGVEHRVIDVSVDHAALDHVRAMGYLALPVVVAGDGTHWSGFRPDRLDMLVSRVA